MYLSFLISTSFYSLYHTIFLKSANFDAINAAQYSIVRDSPELLPSGLLSTCANNINNNVPPSSTQVTVQPSDTNNGNIVTSSEVASQCGDNTVCIIPFGTTWSVDSSINLGALIVRGSVEWYDSTQVLDNAYLCAGYVAVEGNGSWDMKVSKSKLISSDLFDMYISLYTDTLCTVDWFILNIFKSLTHSEHML